LYGDRKRRRLTEGRKEGIGKERKGKEGKGGRDRGRDDLQLLF
jgi:hypothetical protein